MVFVNSLKVETTFPLAKYRQKPSLYFFYFFFAGGGGGFRARRTEMAAESRWQCTSGEAARKTSGTERFNSPCSLDFDIFLSD